MIETYPQVNMQDTTPYNEETICLNTIQDSFERPRPSTIQEVGEEHPDRECFANQEGREDSGISSVQLRSGAQTPCLNGYENEQFSSLYYDQKPSNNLN